MGSGGEGRAGWGRVRLGNAQRLHGQGRVGGVKWDRVAQGRMGKDWVHGAVQGGMDWGKVGLGHFVGGGGRASQSWARASREAGERRTVCFGELVWVRIWLAPWICECVEPGFHGINSVLEFFLGTDAERGLQNPSCLCHASNRAFRLTFCVSILDSEVKSVCLDACRIVGLHDAQVGSKYVTIKQQIGKYASLFLSDAMRRHGDLA